MAVGWSDKGQLPGHGLEPHGQGTVLRIGRPGCGATAIELHGISGLMVFPALHVLVCAGRGVVYGHGFLLEHPSPFHAVAGVGPGVVDLPFILGYMGGEPLRLGHGRGYRLVKPRGKERGFQGFPGTRAMVEGSSSCPSIVTFLYSESDTFWMSLRSMLAFISSREFRSRES